MVATMYGHKKVVDELLNAGADPDIINDVLKNNVLHIRYFNAI